MPSIFRVPPYSRYFCKTSGIFWPKVLPSRHAQAYTTERLPTGYVLLLLQLYVFIWDELIFLGGIPEIKIT